MPSTHRLQLWLRYGLVSGTCLVLNNLFFIVTDRLSQPILVGVGSAFFVVGVIGFRLHCRYTFRTTPSWIGLARYLGAMTVNTPLFMAILWTFSVYLAWPMVLAGPVASLGMIVVNFLTSRLAIERHGARCRQPC